MKNRKVIKAATWYTISNMLLRAVSLITAPIFTRMLSTADYGIASNFTTWTSIIYCVTGLGLSTGIIRGKIEFKEDFKKYLSAVQTMGFLFALVILIISIPLLDVLSEFMVIDKLLIVAMLIYLLFYPSVGYAQINYRFEYRYRENILISILNTVGTVFCSIGLILMWTQQRYIGRILGTIIPMFVMGIIFFIKISIEGHCFIDLKYWMYALKISLPMIPHGLAMIVLGQIDRAMIMKICGESEAGIYSFGYSYGILLSMVTNAVNDAIQPMIYGQLEKKDDTAVNRLVVQMITLSIVLAKAVMVVGPEALRILGPVEYFDARWTICPVVIGTLFQFVYQNFSLVEVYYKKTITMAIGSILAAIINISLNMIFITKYGYLAAAYTTLASYAFLMIFHYVGAWKVAGRKIFQIRIVLSTTVLSLAIGLGFNCLYGQPIWLRYIVGVITFGLGIFYMRRFIIQLLKSMLKR